MNRLRIRLVDDLLATYGMFRFPGLIAVALLGSVCVAAQPGCPAVSFQAAYSQSLTPTPSSHVIALKEADNSYTAYEVANASPYTVIATTPQFEKQLKACPPGAPATSSGSFTPAVARTQAGGYLFVSADAEVDAAEFDQNLNLISEVRYTIPPAGGNVTLADVNEDGNPDIIIADTLGDAYGAAVVVLLGSGGTSFQAPVSYPISTSLLAGAVTVGDVNGDNKPDVLVGSCTSIDEGPRTCKISVFLGNGDGTFQPERVVLSGLGSPLFLSFADLNRDGKADLVFIDSGVEVALGSGAGTFATPVAYAVSTAVSLAVGDVNGDGIPDIVTNAASILLGDGKGGFSNPRNYATEANGQVILTDFDGDGIIDIVIADGNASAIYGGTITVLCGRGGGTFFAPPLSLSPILAVDSDLTALRAADFNHDAIPDVVVSDSLGNINVLQGAEDGVFQPVFTYKFPAPAQIPWNIVTGDFNRDGKVDFAVVQSGYVASGSGSVQVFLGNGDGTFQPPLEIPAPLAAFSLVTADFNGDGKLDLAVLVSQQGSYIEGQTSIPDGSILIFLGNGDGTFTSHGSYAVEPGAFAITAGDFNNDGTPDLAVLSVSRGAPNQNGDILILAGKGDGTFAIGADVPLTGGGTNITFASLAAADLNNDGKLDLAAALSNGQAGSGEFVVLLGRGDGTFQPPVSHGSSIIYVTIGDLNGDRVPDLIVTGESETGYFLGNGDGTFQPEAAFFGLSAPFITLDFAGEGRLNIAGFSEGAFTGIATLLNISPPARPRRPR